MQNLNINGIKQNKDINVNVFSLSLNKTIYIEQNLIKFESEKKNIFTYILIQ